MEVIFQIPKPSRVWPHHTGKHAHTSLEWHTPGRKTTHMNVLHIISWEKVPFKYYLCFLLVWHDRTCTHECTTWKSTHIQISNLTTQTLRKLEIPFSTIKQVQSRSQCCSVKQPRNKTFTQRDVALLATRWLRTELRTASPSFAKSRMQGAGHSAPSQHNPAR